MKKRLFPAAACLIALAACNDDEIKVADPVCQITAPAEGSEIYAYDPFIITAEGEVPGGSEIASVALKIDGVEIPEVTEVPFSYEVAADTYAPGSHTITLEVANSRGITAQSAITISLSDLFTDTRDGKAYKTVKIGDQVWFAENLAYLPEISKVKDDYSKTEPRYYVYDYTGTDIAEAKATANFQKCGVLYNWAAAGGYEASNEFDENHPDVQGPCPDGWHIPVASEWNELFTFVSDRIPDSEAASSWQGDNQKNVCGHLRAKDWPIATDEDLPQLALGGMDTYGFGASYYGCCLKEGFYYGPGSYGSVVCYFWTPHFDNYTYGYSGGMLASFANYKYIVELTHGTDQGRGYSIRCLKN